MVCVSFVFCLFVFVCLFVCLFYLFLSSFRVLYAMLPESLDCQFLMKVALNIINPNINLSYVCEEMSYKWQKLVPGFFLKRSIRFSCQIIMFKYRTIS